MRLEIDISDDRPEAQILGSVSDPGEYVLELVRMDGGRQDHRVQARKPSYSEIFEQGQSCPSAFKSREQVDLYVAELRNEWR